MRKNLLITLVSIFLISNCQAQVFQWGMEIESSLVYSVDKVRSDSMGNVYLLGHHFTSLDFVSPSLQFTHTDTSGGSKVFLAKLDPSGNPLWVKSWGSSSGVSQLIVGDLEIDRDQRLYVACHYPGMVDIDSGPGVLMVGSNDSIDQTPIVSVLNMSGDLLRYDVLDTNILPEVDLALDPAGNLYLTGIFRDSIDADPSPNQAHWLAGGSSSNNQFVSKWDSSGQHLWSYSNHSDYLQSTGINVDKWGNVYTFGVMNTQINFGSTQGPTGNYTALPSPPTASKDGFAQKVNTHGIQVWAMGIDAALDNEVFHLAPDDLGNVYWLGTYEGSIDLDPGPGVETGPFSGTSQVYTYLLKLDSLGQYAWGRVSTGDGITRGTKLAIDPNGFIYTFGIGTEEVDLAPGPLQVLYPPYGANFVFAQVLDQNGNFVNAWTTQGAAIATYLGDAHLTNQGEMLLTGQTFNGVDLDPEAGNFPLFNALGLQTTYLTQWNATDAVNGFQIVVDHFVHPSCSGPGLASWFPIGGLPPYQYFLDGIPLGSDTSVIIPITGLYTISAIDSLGQSFARQFLANGPTDLQNFDLRASIIAPSMRPGVPATILIDVSNQGCLPVSGEVFFVPDSNLTFLSSTPTPNRFNGDSIFWTLNFLNYDSGNVVLQVMVLPDSNAQLGQQVCADAGISIISGDLNIANNLVHYCENLVNSYDPNDIQVYPKGACEEGYVLPNQPLTYRVRFQNSGNAPAIKVEIRDTFPLALDLNTLRILSTSHSGLITEVGPGQAVHFRFDNIQLPDSTSDPEASQGFILYEISPYPSLVSGTVAENRAGIYFDFNPPVITNTVRSIFTPTIPVCDPVNLPPTADLGALTLFPNPTDGTIFLNWSGDTYLHNANIEIYSGTGKLVSRSHHRQLNQLQIDLPEAHGLYFLRISSHLGNRVFRVFVQ